MRQVFETFGKLTILINCAALINYKPVQDTTDEDFHRLIDTNLCGYFYCLRAAYPYLKQSGGGRIVQFSSSTALSGSGFANIATTASKSAAIGMTKHVAGLWAKDNIRANTICPGLTETPITTPATARSKTAPPTKLPSLWGASPSPATWPAWCSFLVSDESRYMTGTTLHVNGGKYMYGI